MTDYDFDYETNGEIGKIVSNNWRTTDWIRENFEEDIGNAIVIGGAYTTIVGPAKNITGFARKMLDAEFSCEADHFLRKSSFAENLSYHDARLDRIRLALKDIEAIEIETETVPNPDMITVQFVMDKMVEGQTLMGAAYFDFRKKCQECFEKRGFEFFSDNQGNVPFEVTLRDRLSVKTKDGDVLGQTREGGSLKWNESLKEVVADTPTAPAIVQDIVQGVADRWTDDRLRIAYDMVAMIIEEHSMESDPMPEFERIKNQIRNADRNLDKIIRGRVS
jgi:hypothetical protein